MRTERVEGNVHYVELLGTPKTSSIYNKQPIVHIIGEGQEVALIPDEKGIAIGSCWKPLYDGGWALFGISELKELRLENIHITVITNKEFSLGDYNKQNDVKITVIGEGSIKCPEARWHSMLLYPAEPKFGGAGYMGEPKYILSSVEGAYQFCQEQEDIINGDRELMSRINYHTTPAMIQFIKETDIVPSAGFYDENIPTPLIEMMKAALSFGVSQKVVWEIYQKISPYRHLPMFRKYIREAMYDLIYPDWREPNILTELNQGKLFKLFDLANKPKPKVDKENMWIYKYLIPPIGLEDTLENLQDALRFGIDADRAHALQLFVDKKFKYRDKVSMKELKSPDQRYKIWECGKMANGVLIYDTQEKLSMYCNTMFPFTQIMKMHNNEVMSECIVYHTTQYDLKEAYQGLKAGTYVFDRYATMTPKTLSKLEDAVSKGIAVKYKKDPVLEYCGNSYYFEVLDYA